jgi:hypothetical protein
MSSLDPDDAGGDQELLSNWLLGELTRQGWEAADVEDMNSFLGQCGIRTLGAIRLFGLEDLGAAVSLYVNDDSALGTLRTKGICATLRVRRASSLPPPQQHISCH